jgi:hypothetical protein
VDERASVSIDASGERPTRTWAPTYGSWIAGRSHLDAVDALATEMETKWGVGRLRLLVPADLREKFDRQRLKLNAAIWHGQSIEDVRIESERMIKAWRALDAKATTLAQEPLAASVWEVALADGSVAVLTRSEAEAAHVVASGRAVAVYTLDEIARLIDGNRLVTKVKTLIPGATVVATRRPSDPLDALPDSRGGLDQPFDDPLPW